MKKSLIALTLALLQCACASQDPIPSENNLLLSFEEIGAEITVSHEKTESDKRVSQTAALGFADPQ